MAAQYASAPAPMLPLRLFRSRTFAAANLTAFRMNAALLAGARIDQQDAVLAIYPNGQVDLQPPTGDYSVT
jgi:hypothetical protein